MGIPEAEVACELFGLLFSKKLILRLPFESKDNLQRSKIEEKSKPRKNGTQGDKVKGFFASVLSLPVLEVRC